MQVFINSLFTEIDHEGRRIPLSQPYAERIAVLIYVYGRPVGDHTNLGVTGGNFEIDDPEASAELIQVIVAAEGA